MREKEKTEHTRDSSKKNRSKLLITFFFLPLTDVIYFYFRLDYVVIKEKEKKRHIQPLLYLRPLWTP